ncbi:MAG: hypothetical protein LAO24_15295 [Acidobacteriia bacterium]|nr:hypothetical protein [Terriglobia bacterium]
MLSRYIRYRTVIRAILGLLIFQLLAAVAFAQRGLEPQWVYFAPKGKIKQKTVSVPGGSLKILGGILLRPGMKAIFMGANGKPGKVQPQLYVRVTNESPGQIWVEAEVRTPGQQEAKVKDFDIKKSGYYHFEIWDLGRDVQWDTEYPVKLTFYSDKEKKTVLSTEKSAFVFTKEHQDLIEEAQKVVAEGLRAGALPYGAVSGWKESLSVEELAAEAAEEKEAHLKPDFEWNDASTSGASLKFTETSRKKMKGTGPVVEYELHAQGFKQGDKLLLWSKWLDDTYQRWESSVDQAGAISYKIKGENVPVRNFNFFHMAHGEPIRWALVSEDATTKAFAVVVPFPLESHGKGECTASARLESPTGLVFLLSFSGFQPGEPIDVTSEFKSESKKATQQASAQGTTEMPVLFGEGDKGKAKVTASSKTCEVSLSYKVGPDARVAED